MGICKTLDWAFANEEASVIITRWPCALKKFSKKDIEEFNKPFTTKCEVVEDLCIGCKKCTKTGCPAISYNKETKKSKIDKNQCLGCEVCAQVCPVVEDLCIGCKKCTKTGCPAISYNKETKKSKIDKNQCLGCEVCAQVCPKEAIVKEVK